VKVKIYVEGGGQSDYLKREFTRKFRELLIRAGLDGRLPEIHPCGTRGKTFSSFCTAHSQAIEGTFCILLVDSEGPVPANQRPRAYLKKRDRWDSPRNASDRQIHLMIQCVETWLLADIRSLKNFYGQGFKERGLPTRNWEGLAKDDVFQKLKAATSKSKSKGPYNKAAHSFDLLSKLDPVKLKSACPSAKRFDVLDLKCHTR
jgi:Domain of unknown function (DUF4276)